MVRFFMTLLVALAATSAFALSAPKGEKSVTGSAPQSSAPTVQNTQSAEGLQALLRTHLKLGTQGVKTIDQLLSYLQRKKRVGQLNQVTQASKEAYEAELAKVWAQKRPLEEKIYALVTVVMGTQHNVDDGSRPCLQAGGTQQMCESNMKTYRESLKTEKAELMALRGKLKGVETEVARLEKALKDLKVVKL